MKLDVNYSEKFENRHNGLSEDQINDMLKVVKADSLDQLIAETIPESIRLAGSLNLPEAKSEGKFIDDLRAQIAENELYDTYIGMGYYNTVMPASYIASCVV